MEKLKTQRPDLLVSDVVMPGDQNGIYLADAARRIYPDLPIILVSGYNTSWPEAEARGLPMLTKPFSIEEFQKALSSLTKAA